MSLWLIQNASDFQVIEKWRDQNFNAHRFSSMLSTFALRIAQNLHHLLPWFQSQVLVDLQSSADSLGAVVCSFSREVKVKFSRMLLRTSMVSCMSWSALFESSFHLPADDLLFKLYSALLSQAPFHFARAFDPCYTNKCVFDGSASWTQWLACFLLFFRCSRAHLCRSALAKKIHHFRIIKFCKRSSCKRWKWPSTTLSTLGTCIKHWNVVNASRTTLREVLARLRAD